MKKNFLIIVLLVMVVALGYFVWSKEVVAPSEEVPDVAPVGLTTFTNGQYGFSFQYPADLEIGDDSIVIAPNYEERIPAKSFTRKLDKEYCDLSGLPEGCKPYTDNPKVYSVVIGGSVDGLVKEWTELFGAPEMVSIGGREFSFWTQGAEGEGMNYYFTELSPDLTLLLAYRYLDENTLISYKGYPGFWDLAKQKEVFESIVSSLKVN